MFLRVVAGALALAGVPLTAMAQAAPPDSPHGYLCCNMRIDRDWISDINYVEDERLIPAGTPVRVIGIGKYIVRIEMDGAQLTLGNDYSRKLDMMSFAKRYIVPDDPSVALAQASPEVQQAVKEARILPGMTREQVLMSRGYPILDENPSLFVPLWKYWLSSDDEFDVAFDAEGKVKEVKGDPKVLAQVFGPGDGAQAAAQPTEEKACTLNVFRNNPTGALVNSDRPFLFVDDKKLGKLALGQSYCLDLPEGRHHVAIRESFLLMPGHTSGEMDVDLKAGSPVFVRYSKTFSHIEIAGTTATRVDSNELQPATQTQWRLRE